ncbi:MAG: serine hydrolase [Cyclobacteriaceae bacterium]
MTFKTLFFILFSSYFIISVSAQSVESDLLWNFENSIDSIVNHAIVEKAFPGCVVYASKNDSIIIKQAYGFHTYDSLRPVDLDDIYDLASVTKVSAATLALMKLYEQNLLSLDDPIKKYIKCTGHLRNLTFRQLLAHQAGLKGWIPFYQTFKKRNGKYRHGTISAEFKDGFRIDEDQMVSSKIYKKIKRQISRSKVDKHPEYKYSGLFFYLVPELVENLSGLKFEDYLNKSFFDTLGTTTLTFNPLNKFSKDHIVPTEIDTFFRMSPIHGKVHDEGATLMAGVSGNAGLFSNINDLAKLWKMLLNGGELDSIRYLKASTIQLFTSYQYPNVGNRRGLGFDKPLLEYDPVISSISKHASILSYGHSGYTGTLVWADPEHDLLFIFLTNRVYPNRTYKKIYELNIRPALHDQIYDLLLPEIPNEGTF